MLSDRRAAHFEHVLHGLAWTWQPHDGCRFSPPATSVDKWFAWAAAREADAGPMLFVGLDMIKIVPIMYTKKAVMAG